MWRLPVWVVWIAVLDFAVFACAWLARLFARAGLASGLLVRFGAWSSLYWATAFLGLVLSVYGFLALTRGGAKQLRTAVVCILFAMVPGCVGLVALLSRIGNKPV